MISEERSSESPYVESVMRGWTVKEGSSIRPAEIHWHMVFVKHPGGTLPIIVGPLRSSGVASWGEGAEILWIKFKLGVFIPHLPMKGYLDGEQVLPNASSQRFWWKGAARQIPDFENVESFIDRLVREDDLVRDPVVSAVLKDEPLEMSDRTVRHRFLQAFETVARQRAFGENDEPGAVGGGLAQLRANGREIFLVFGERAVHLNGSNFPGWHGRLLS